MIGLLALAYAAIKAVAVFGFGMPAYDKPGLRLLTHAVVAEQLLIIIAGGMLFIFVGWHFLSRLNNLNR